MCGLYYCLIARVLPSIHWVAWCCVLLTCHCGMLLQYEGIVCPRKGREGERGKVGGVREGERGKVGGEREGGRESEGRLEGSGREGGRVREGGRGGGGSEREGGMEEGKGRR